LAVSGRLAAVLACGPGAVLSHTSAAAHWGLLHTDQTHRVIVETDGFETHGTRAAFRNDRAKDAALTASGYRVLRFTRDDDPELAIKRVRALLA
jgi:uncharacterized protein DUF559